MMATGTEVERLTLTIPEAAKVLGISRGTAYALINQGVIPALRLGRRLIVPRDALLRMLAEADEPKE
jgi:excisionase family DNA binding protein